MEGLKYLALFCSILLPLTSFAGSTLNLKTGIITPAETPLRSLKSGGEKIAVFQFRERIRPSDRAALTENGLQILRYLPEDAFVVRGNTEDLASLAATLPSLRTATEFLPAWKIAPELVSMTEKKDLSIEIFDTSLARNVARKIARAPGMALQRIEDRNLIVRTDLRGVQAIAQWEEVEWIEALPGVETFQFPIDLDPVRGAPLGDLSALTGFESGNRLIGIEAAWSRGFTGSGQIAAMGDSGLDSGNPAMMHPDFSGKIKKGFAIGFWSKSWKDSNGHGTHVAGSIVGSGSSSGGKIRGAAYGADFVPVGLWSPILRNLSFGKDFRKVIGDSVAEGARVHSNSWGSAVKGAYDSFAVNVDAYAWNNPDVLILFAAGNSGVDANKDGKIDGGSIASPGTAKNVLTVGASENFVASGGIQKSAKQLAGGPANWGAEPIASDTASNNPSGIAFFSSVGPTKDGRIKPEIVAPGTNILSTRSHDRKASALWGEFDANYVWSGGTSMATPITAGAATVLREYLIKDRKIANPSGMLLKATLIHTAKDLAPGQYGTGPQQELMPRPDFHQGFGLVDMDRATSFGENSRFVDDRIGVALNEIHEEAFLVSDRGTLRVTLSYADAPGSAAAGIALVNDLELSVSGPNAFRSFRADALNNTEMVELKGLAPGIYRVTVRGGNIPQGKSEGRVPFALVISE